MTEPISTKHFEKYVPHRPPMIWVDEVLSANEHDGECRVWLRPTALYMKNGRIRPYAFVEWIAQSYAFVKVAYILKDETSNYTAPSKAFLVGIRNAQFTAHLENDEVHSSPSVHIFVRNFREFGPLTIFDGEVRTPTDQVLLHANLKVYKP